MWGEAQSALFSLAGVRKSILGDKWEFFVTTNSSDDSSSTIIGNNNEIIEEDQSILKVPQAFDQDSNAEHQEIIEGSNIDEEYFQSSDELQILETPSSTIEMRKLDDGVSNICKSSEIRKLENTFNLQTELILKELETPSRIESCEKINEEVDDVVNVHHRAISEGINSESMEDEVEDEEPDIIDHSIIKKKKKKHKKKKPTSDNSHHNNSILKTSGKPKAGNSTKKNVKWGSVQELFFTQEVSYSSVPNKGLHPLGLGQEVESLRHICSVDELFRSQQINLLDRAKAIGITIPTMSNNSSNGSTIGGQKSVYLSPLLETRQFDYKGYSNLLYQSVSEDERIALLMNNKIEWTKLTDSSSSSSKPNITNNHTHKDKDQCNNNNSLLAELNKDLRNIQLSRQEFGCSCKPMKIDKLSNGKMKSLLLDNQYHKEEVESLSKVDLACKVREVLKSCFLCVSTGCECVQLEVSCSSNLCHCMRQGAVQSCGNTLGREMFDAEAVKSYRLKVIKEYRDSQKIH